MTAVKATYKNGEVKLESQPNVTGAWKAIVTLIEEKVEKNGVEKPSPAAGKDYISQFSWAKSRELTKEYKGSFADAVIEEREEYR